MTSCLINNRNFEEETDFTYLGLILCSSFLWFLLHYVAPKLRRLDIMRIWHNNSSFNMLVYCWLSNIDSHTKYTMAM